MECPNNHCGMHATIRNREENMNKTTLFVLVILTLLLAACSGGAAKPTAAPTAAPTEVPPTEAVKAEAPAEPAST